MQSRYHRRRVLEFYRFFLSLNSFYRLSSYEMFFRGFKGCPVCSFSNHPHSVSCILDTLHYSSRFEENSNMVFNDDLPF